MDNKEQRSTNNKEKDIPRSKTYQEQKKIKCQWCQRAIERSTTSRSTGQSICPL